MSHYERVERRRLGPRITFRALPVNRCSRARTSCPTVRIYWLPTTPPPPRQNPLGSLLDYVRVISTPIIIIIIIIIFYRRLRGSVRIRTVSRITPGLAPF